MTAARDAGLAQDSAEYKALDYQIKMHQQTYNEIAYIYDAHQVKMTASALTGEQDRAAILADAYGDIDEILPAGVNQENFFSKLVGGDAQEYKYTYTDP